MTEVIVFSISNERDYISKINTMPFLSSEEEYMLARSLKDYNDLDAAQKLIVSHLRLVVKIANSYKYYGLPFLDLVQEGTIGLMQAVKKFDVDKGFKLATYATWWIKASINDYVINSWSLVKIGTTSAQRKLFYNLKSIKNRIGKYDNNQLSKKDLEIIAKELEVEENEVLDMDLRLTNPDKSLNEPINFEDQTGELIDLIPSETEIHDLVILENSDLKYKKKLFNEALSVLSERELEILKLKYFKESPLTVNELASKYSVSRQRIEEIEKNIIKKIKNYVQLQN